ncbi:MAG: dicarboxylate/amino acid:cation symporter [Bacteroides sp.]|nr:dicarboxylate/amino acid:cation symporter [Bacteroides sp.]
MKNLHLGLLPRIVIAILLGIGVGNFLPSVIVRIFLTFNSLFSEFLNFSIPLIILGLVTVAIFDIGKAAGKLLLTTVVLAYGFTVFSGFFSYFMGEMIFPQLITPEISLESIQQVEVLSPYFKITIPPVMDVISALVLAFILGLGLSAMSGEAFKNVARDFQQIVFKVIQKVIVPLLPLYIFGIFSEMTYSGQVLPIIKLFINIIWVIFLIHVLVILLQYTIAGSITGRNPFRLLSTMLPAYFTALGTQSSAATIPVTLAQTKKMGVSEGIAGFVVPLCATIHLSGSTLKIVACALALMMMQGMPYNFPLFAGFILMLGIAMVAAPGVPGGAIMAALGILHSILGFDEPTQALMIALYIGMDSFGTACNVTGDGAIAILVEKIYHPRKTADKCADL